MLFFFFVNDTATTEIYTLSLHDALPISCWASARGSGPRIEPRGSDRGDRAMLGRIRSPPPSGWRSARLDRKSTRLNSSHGYISYAVFCLKKKKNLSRPPLSGLRRSPSAY